jgi:hypothetical protein
VETQGYTTVGFNIGESYMVNWGVKCLRIRTHVIPDTKVLAKAVKLLKFQSRHYNLYWLHALVLHVAQLQRAKLYKSMQQGNKKPTNMTTH